MIPKMEQRVSVVESINRAQRRRDLQECLSGSQVLDVVVGQASLSLKASFCHIAFQSLVLYSSFPISTIIIVAVASSSTPSPKPSPKWDFSPLKSGRTAANPRSRTPSQSTIVLNPYHPYPHSQRNIRLTMGNLARSRLIWISRCRSYPKKRRSREILWRALGTRLVRRRWLGGIKSRLWQGLCMLDSKVITDNE